MYAIRSYYGFLVRPATDADNLALCALSKVPIAGQISLSLERCPDYFAGARIQNESYNFV